MRRRIHVLISVILLLNSLVGITELVLGTTFLPRVAGAVLVYSDTRSIGIVGHPLTSSFLTGLMLVYLIVSRLMSRFDGWALLQIVVHAGGLVAFGGRVALVTTIAIVALYVVFDGNTIIRRAPVLKSFRRLLFIIAGLAVGAFILTSGLADNTLARFTSDQGSAQTRSAALDLVGKLPAETFIFGVSPAERAAIARAFGTEFGIEVTWIAWLVDFGVFITAGLVLYLFILLRICLRGAQRYHWYMTAYFLVCITGSQGLGSKTLLLTWFVLIMCTFGRQPAKPALTAAAPGGRMSAATAPAGTYHPAAAGRQSVVPEIGGT